MAPNIPGERAVSTEPLYGSLSSSTSIRVLILQPGSGEDVLRITLEETDLGTRSHVPYEAISYTWGSAAIQRPIALNGHTVNIRSNLWNCLRRLRLPEQPRRLWADAICISQVDLREKAQQVSIIGDIFQKAERVIAWLGDDGDDSQLIIEDLQIKQDVAGESETPPSDTQRALLTLSFLNRRYWQRLWIVQELILADRIQFQIGGRPIYDYQLKTTDLSSTITRFCPDLSEEGSHCLFISHGTFLSITTASASRVIRSQETRIANWSAKSDHRRARNLAEMGLKKNEAFTMADRFGYNTNEMASRYDPTTGLGRFRWQPDSLITYVEQFRYSNCEHPLDQVYAVLSLAKTRTKPLPFQPDYTIELPTLLTRTFEYTIKSKQYQPADLLEVLFRSLIFSTDDLRASLTQWSQNPTLNQPAIKRAALLAVSRWEIFRLPGFDHITYDDSDPFTYQRGKYNFSNEFPVSRWYSGSKSRLFGSGSKRLDQYFGEMLDLLDLRQEEDLDVVEEWETECRRQDRGKNVSYERWGRYKDSIRAAIMEEDEDEEEEEQEEDGLEGGE